MIQLKSILILNLSAIGDAVSSSVVINHLKEKYGVVDLAVPAKIGELFAEDPSINLIDLDDVNLKNYDFFVDLTSSKFSRVIAKGVKAKIKVARIWNIWRKIMSLLVYNVFVEGHRGHIVRDYYPIFEYLGYEKKSLPKFHRLEDRKSAPAQQPTGAAQNLLHFVP